MIDSEELVKLNNSLMEVRERLIKSQVYDDIKGVEDLKLFMEYHVFAVWDFMSLLKSLQMLLTCVTTPWIPVKDPQISRLINEIVIGEESDEIEEGKYSSHFEMYKTAMEQLGANTAKIDSFINLIREGVSVNDALKKCEVPEAIADFVKTTFKFIETGKPHIIAAAFTFGREEVIPDMFKLLVKDLQHKMPEKVDLFCDYLERHIHLDAEVHTPLVFKMIEKLCGNDQTKWNEARETAVIALEARIKLWNSISAIISKR